jgi:spore maturation protein CgeB
MRADTLNQILQPSLFEVIDTHVPFYKSNPFWRTLAFRFKKGKVISDTNRYILKQLTGKYDLIWVDKAVFISDKVTKILRIRTNHLVHYTPDTAFEENTSDLFYNSLSYYDYVITTKSFEKEAYLKYISTEKLLCTPQGFNRKLHYSRHPIKNKLNRVIFVGLYEAARGKVISALLKENIPVALAGKNWKDFVKRHQTLPLTFLGEGLFSEAYANAISESAIGLGLVSKRFPELHTTRTFEIPACGTALATERNEETLFFLRKTRLYFFLLWMN